MSDAAQDRVLLGRVSGVFGVRGWLKLYSYTAPPENILDYSHWELRRGDQWQRLRLVNGRSHGKALVAQLADTRGTPITDRDTAAQWLDADIAVLRSDLPGLATGEFYRAELLGLRVRTLDGIELGQVADFMDTGANPVMLVRGAREHLIPFVRDTYITRVDIDAGLIEADWDSDY